MAFLKRYITKKVNAGILPLVLSISIIIATICSTIIFLAYYFRLESISYKVQNKLGSNVHSGIQYLLADESIQSNQSLVVDLYSEGKDSVKLIKKTWGVYDVVMSVAFQGEHVNASAALLGAYRKPTDPKVSLYLVDEHRPLSIAGKTRISGDVYIPKAGIKTAYINKKGYAGKQLVYGQVNHSTTKMPEIDLNSFEEVFQLFESSSSEVYHINEEEDYEEGEYKSFTDDHTLLLYESGNISKSVRGNIILLSTRKITITSSAFLEDVIVIAPQIVVKRGFRGKAQLFALDSIIMESNSVLEYPSALSIIGNSDRSSIVLEEGASLSGFVGIANEKGDYRKKLFKMEKGAKLIGQAYIQGLVELKGAIHGELVCRKFFLRTRSTIYENHLLDAVLDVKKLSPFYIGTSLLSDNNKRGIVKWLR